MRIAGRAWKSASIRRGLKRAVIAGLDLDADIGALERLFVAGLCGLAYGLADVIDAFAANNVVSRMVVMAGGG